MYVTLQSSLDQWWKQCYCRWSHWSRPWRASSRGQGTLHIFKLFKSVVFLIRTLLKKKIYRWSEGRKCLRTQWRSFRPLSNFVGNWERWLMQEPLQMSSLIQPGTVTGISKHFEAFLAFKVWKSVSNTFTNCSYLNSSNSFLLINTPYFYWFEQVQSYSCWTKTFRAWVK